MCHRGVTLASYRGTCGGVPSLKVVLRWVSKRKQYDTTHTHLLKVTSPLCCTNTTLTVVTAEETTYPGVGPVLTWAEAAAIFASTAIVNKTTLRAKCKGSVVTLWAGS